MTRDPVVELDSDVLAIDRRVAHVLRLLEGRHRSYQRAALDEAVTLGPPIVPGLLQILARVVAEPHAYVGLGGKDYAGHLYALALLSHAREPRAHDAVVRLARLPESLCEALLGEGVTELLPAALYATSGGGLAALWELALDPQVFPGARDAALGAIVLAVLDGGADRQEVLRRFAALLGEPDRSKADMDFVTAVATRALDLYPEEIAEALEQAFRRGRIDPFALAWADCEQQLLQPREQVLAESRAAMAEALSADVHGLFAGWCPLEDPGRDADGAGRDLRARQRALAKKRRTERRRSRKARKRRR